MNEKSIFNGISADLRQKIVSKYGKGNTIYSADETIMTLLKNDYKIGVLEKGSANLGAIDIDGNYILMEKLNKNDIFGSLFIYELDGFEYIITANEDCTVTFLNCNSVLNSQEPVNSKFIYNLFSLICKKSQNLFLRNIILSQKTIRAKIMNYLKYVSNVNSSPKFKLDISLNELADFLCVDRSSMMREIAKMKRDGLITSKGRYFNIL